ncbi:MAG TPA: redox-regulated ATPase YchF [Dehalococcoidia bacterium]|nr:redox-regulated ATPase YchF [Dehalococcoidia bacterium]
MEICIIGLPKSGKTTIFNALTKGTAETKPYASAALAPNIGMAKVPEPRLAALTSMFHSKKTTPAEIKYVDIAGATKTFSKSEGFDGQLLSYLSNADALIHVIRNFNNETVPHIEGSIDPKRDAATLDMELIFSDLAIIERKIQRLESSLKSSKPGERDNAIKEQALMKKIKEALEKEIPIWQQKLTADEMKGLANYQFLTAKPMLIVINIDENQLAQAQEIEAQFRSLYPNAQFDIIALCGKLEMELTQLNDADAEAFRKDLNLSEPALNRLIKRSYKLLGLISFFTTGEDESKAWTIRNDTQALKAAGKIHSDIERGFIRAEVIHFDDLIRTGGMAEARKQGLLRLEGKGYVVQDGDVINFLFNV